MKKLFVRITVAVIIFSILSSLILGLVVTYAKNNINYDLDEELFTKAKEDQTVYFYAYNSLGKPEIIHKSTKSSSREWTAWEDIGENIKLGFLAMEDREFYSHHGVNYKRTALAAVNHLLKFKNSFGASTITQQLIKNISGDNETSITRKLKEILRSFNLESNHSKDDIFELYLNVIPMAGNIYGVGAAAEIYFGKNANDLSLAEAATLVGITNAPSKYNPYTNPVACVEKRNRVLFAMLDANFIREEVYNDAINTPLILSESKSTFGVASWFVETAIEEIIEDISLKYSISHTAARLMLNGSHVILTMNPRIQNILEEYFSNLENLSENVAYGLNYSMAVTDPYTGNLLGIIGNCGNKKASLLYNYATSPITPGSVLKPLALYAPAINSGMICWSSMIEDSPVSYTNTDQGAIPYPKNTPDVYDGLIDVNEALKKSKNTVAIRIFNMLGVEKTFKHLTKDYGFTTLIKSEKTEKGTTVSDLGPAPLALGQLSYGVSLRKLTEAYNVFPNNGVLATGKSYEIIYDQRGKTIIKKENTYAKIYSAETAQIMNQLLSNVVESGTARQIKLKESIDVGGKTGTSGQDRDRLFIGYTPYYTCGIWCGYGKYNKEVGHNTPNHLQIWDSIMTKIHEELVFSGYSEMLRSFHTDKLLIAPYCSKSGQIPTEKCELNESDIRLGYFSNDDAPKCECEYHQ